MLSEREAPLEFFRSVLMTVVGQAYQAAGYELEHQPVKWAGGMFRFSKPLDDTLTGYIDYQTLVYTPNAYAARQPSRFQVTLTRSDRTGARGVRRTLSALVVDDFGVQILPSAGHWWTYTDTDSLGQALAEAGHLVVGYGIPWLAGDLSPDDATS